MHGKDVVNIITIEEMENMLLKSWFLCHMNFTRVFSCTKTFECLYLLPISLSLRPQVLSLYNKVFSALTFHNKLGNIVIHLLNCQIMLQIWTSSQPCLSLTCIEFYILTSITINFCNARNFFTLNLY